MMSSKKSRKNRDKKKNRDDKDDKRNSDKYTRQGNGTNNGNEELSAVTFKYPGRFATLTRTILLNENLTIKELQRKVTLSISQTPPEAKTVFQLYYMDEIFPFINKHAQETINTKKSIEKSWDLQTSHFQKIYMKRSDLLRQEWSRMKNGGSGSSKNNKNGHYTVTNHHHHYHYDHGTNDGDKDNDNDSSEVNSTTVIFKYYSVHSSAKTNRHIFITQPTKQELLNKIKLSLSSNPPTAKELFEIYYYDEILPFLKKSGQQSIRGKKDLSKVWQIQTKTFKNLYEDRAKILMEEWQKMKKETKKKSKKSRNNHNHNHNDTLMDDKKTHSNGYHHRKSLSSSPKASSLSPSSSSSTFGIRKNGEIKSHNKKDQLVVMKKMDCSLIRTLLNFLLFFECTTKDDCFMLLIDDQDERHSEYNKFESYLKSKNDKNDLVYIHLRVCFDNFDSDDLRLHTGPQIIKLCFVNRFCVGDKDENDINKGSDKQSNGKQEIKYDDEELVLFELRFNKLISGLADKIDHQHIQVTLDDETRILSIDVPLL